MAFFDTEKQRAAIVPLLLGIGIAIALAPYASGLLGVPVLYVLFAPFHRWLSRWIRPSIAAVLVILVAFLLIVLPGVWLIGMLVGQAQGVAESLVNSQTLARLSDVRIGQYRVGPQIAQLGREIITWMGSNALGFLGTATRFTLNLLFAFFGLFYVLLNPTGVWRAVEPYIPFSKPNIRILQERFRSVTAATVVGTGLSAVILGILIWIGFAIVGIKEAAFWGVVCAVLAFLPLVGAALVWIPAVVALVIDRHYPHAVFLAVLGTVVLPNVENLVRPVVFRRYSQIHPMITLVGAIAGVSYFGLLGLLIGPLALSYFFEIIRIYREEYLEPEPVSPGLPG